jgi:hypothetical protein
MKDQDSPVRGNEEEERETTVQQILETRGQRPLRDVAMDLRRVILGSDVDLLRVATLGELRSIVIGCSDVAPLLALQLLRDILENDARKWEQECCAGQLRGFIETAIGSPWHSEAFQCVARLLRDCEHPLTVLETFFAGIEDSPPSEGLIEFLLQSYPWMPDACADPVSNAIREIVRVGEDRACERVLLMVLDAVEAGASEEWCGLDLHERWFPLLEGIALGRSDRSLVKTAMRLLEALLRRNITVPVYGLVADLTSGRNLLKEFPTQAMSLASAMLDSETLVGDQGFWEGIVRVVIEMMDGGELPFPHGEAASRFLLSWIRQASVSDLSKLDLLKVGTVLTKAFVDRDPAPTGVMETLEKLAEASTMDGYEFLWRIGVDEHFRLHYCK